MGRKSKEQLAKEAKTLELNRNRAASFFKPKTSAVAKQPLKERSPNTNRVKDFDQTLKPVKNSTTTVASVPSSTTPDSQTAARSKKDFNVFKDQNDVGPVNTPIQDTKEDPFVDQIDAVHPLPVVAVPVADFQYANQLIQVTPGDVNLVDLPVGMFLHGAIEGDGACLFRSVSFAICESQNLYIFYRQQALEFISSHAGMFEADILQMSNRTVDQYVNYMSPDFIFADQIMVIALCLYLDVSITLFQKGAETIDSCTFAPVHGNATKQVNVYLDLYAAHYDCILSSPLAPEQAALSVKSFFSKKQTTSADMLSHSNDENANDFIGKSSIQALENDPETSAHSLKRKAAGITPKVCMTKSHVEGKEAPMGKFKGQMVSFNRNNKKCDLCSDDIKFNHNPKNNPTNNKKAQQREQEAKARIAQIDLLPSTPDLVAERAKLIHDTPNLKRDENHQRIKEVASKIDDPNLKKQKLMESGIFRYNLIQHQKSAETVRTPGNVKEFLEKTAESLRQRSPNFEPNNKTDIEKSKDFIAILSSTGHVTAADVVTPLTNREALIEDVKTNQKFTVHTGLPALFHRSSTFDMVSPDRSVCVRLADGTFFCPDYLDGRQITVLASHFSQRFFNATPYRSRLLNKLILFYLNPIAMKLEFESRFDYMDKRLALVLACETDEKRTALAKKFPQTTNPAVIEKIKQKFSDMKRPNRRDSSYKIVKDMVCDFNSWEEVDDLFRVFDYRCVVSGIAWDEGFILSIDKFVRSGSRYNFFECIPMMWRINDGKNADRKIFETRESLQAYMEANGMADLHPLEALVKILRVQFKALVTHSFALHGYGPQEAFDDSLKANGVEEIEE